MTALGKGFGFSLRPSWRRGTVGSSAHSFPCSRARLSIYAAAESLAMRAVPALCNTAWTPPLLLDSTVPGEEMVLSTVVLPNTEVRPGGAEKLISACAIHNRKALTMLKRTHRSRQETKALSHSKLLELRLRDTHFLKIFSNPVIFINAFQKR